jgi:hypothetical protein
MTGMSVVSIKVIGEVGVACGGVAGGGNSHYSATWRRGVRVEYMVLLEAPVPAPRNMMSGLVISGDISSGIARDPNRLAEQSTRKRRDKTLDAEGLNPLKQHLERQRETVKTRRRKPEKPTTMTHENQKPPRWHGKRRRRCRERLLRCRRRRL